MMEWRAVYHCHRATAALVAIGHGLALSASAAAQETSVPEESRVKPLRSGFRGLESRVLGFGTYKETTQYRTRKRYVNPGVGAIVSYDQAIRGPWSGGLQARWSLWEPQEAALVDEAEAPEQTAPLAAFSRIQFSPRLPFLWGETFDGIVRPFAVGGLGFVGFFEARPTYRRSNAFPSETAATYGGGVRLVWPDTAALRLSFERWRGLRSFRVSALTWQLEVQFGDVSAL